MATLALTESPDASPGLHHHRCLSRRHSRYRRILRAQPVPKRVLSGQQFDGLVRGRPERDGDVVFFEQFRFLPFGSFWEQFADFSVARGVRADDTGGDLGFYSGLCAAESGDGLRISRKNATTYPFAPWRADCSFY